MKKFKKYLVPVTVILTAAILYYIMLPAMNIHDFGFWFFVIVLLVELLALTSLEELVTWINFKVNRVKAVEKKGLKKITIVTLSVIALAVGYIVIVPLIYSPMLMPGRYASRIDVQNVSFSEVPPYNFNTTAIIDRSSAEILGNKVMGEMADLVSQFVVSDEYSQISYKEGTYRVTPLMYDGFVKYLRNHSEGIPGYIIVNTTTGETKLTRLTSKMKYVPSGWFGENMYRKLRFSHPFDIFDEPSFEIDENGDPYYVCTTYTYVGCDSLKRVTGVIVFDPISGESEKYSIADAPSWVDRIYPESLVREEVNDYGLYRNGFINSFLTQEGVIQASEGYNYISKDGDIWLYTGMTSVVSDDSNIGFMLVNLRTHEAQMISVSGADEYSVMGSAEGEVLNYGYYATFPVLVNIGNKPIYILSLKDTAGLVKMYALVDAQDYQQVYTVKADKDAKAAIAELITKAMGSNSSYDDSSIDSKRIIVEKIKELTIDGTTNFMIMFNDEVYKITVNSENAKDVAFLEVGDAVNVTYFMENGVANIVSLESIH